MTRLLIHVEGETEEAFVNKVIAPRLYAVGYHNISARLLGNSRNRDRRGGIRPWPAARKDILNHLKQDDACYAATMVDYYALPKEGDRAWPGRMAADQLTFSAKAPTVHSALLEDICRALGASFNSKRFIPYVMMYEFEGLLFSDPIAFAKSMERPELGERFSEIRNQFGTPEEINDSPTKAPSKRIVELVPGYKKPLFGTLAATEIGLDRIRQECPFFRSWIERLEELAK